MPTVKRNTNLSLNLPCDNPSDTFVVHYTTQGDPFRDGLEIGISNADFDKDLVVMLCYDECISLRNLLLDHYPIGD
jgi:hypothetical protein